MSIIKIHDPDYDFWKMYPDLKKVEEFKQIQKEYKTKSSDVMWFIVLCFDLESKFINLPLEERSVILSKDYLKDKDWYSKNSAKIAPAVAMFEKMNDTPIRRHLRQWTETMEKRTKFLRDTEYDLDNYDKLDKMAIGTDALLKTFERIQIALKKEEGEGVTKGGYIPSLADSEDI